MSWQPELFPDEKALAPDETARHIALGDRIVPYVVRRSRRRTIGLSIDHRGLRVGAPPRATFVEIESLIRQHADWVAAKLDEWRSRRRPTPLRLADGTRLPWLGEELELRLALGGNHVFWSEFGAPRLTLFLRRPGDAARVLETALRERARAHFVARLAHFAAHMKLAVPPLALSSARTRWGSCSTRSGIRLNWRLLHLQPEIVDYVVVHELAHLREMNHGRRFWALVGEHCPDYRARRAELAAATSLIPHW